MKNDDEDKEESLNKDGSEALPNACCLALI